MSYFLKPRKSDKGETTYNIRRMTRKKELTFTLNDINAEEILLLHYLSSGKSQLEEDIPETILDIDEIGITDLMHEKSKKSKRAIHYFDPYKSKIKYWTTMVDVIQNDSLPRYYTKPCWFCRSTFTSHPIGCPIRYHQSLKEESIKKQRIEESLKESNLPIDQGNDFFETEGMFCSFPCVKGHIYEMIAKTKNPKYKRALTLLTLLYQKLTGQLVIIPVAPNPLGLVDDYNGHLTSQEYRAAFGRLEYEETVNVCRPLMYSSRSYIKEKRIRL